MNDQWYNDDLEQFLADTADQHRMFPSDYVWRNIQKKVQEERSWPALSIIAFLIIVSLAVATFLNYPPDNIIAKVHYQDSVRQEQQRVQQALAASKRGEENFEQRLSTANITAKTLAEFKENAAAVAITDSLYNLAQVSVTHVEIARIEPVTIQASKATTTIKTQDVTSQVSLNAALLNAKQEEEAINKETDDSIASAITASSKDSIAAIATATNKAKIKEVKNTPFDEEGYRLARKKSTAITSRWAFDFYITPSISYRKLEDDRIRDKFVTATTTNISLDSSKIKHKPALGMEVGLGLMYNLTRNLRFKTGLQFNVRQYYIDAYPSSAIATIAIVQGNRLDSVNVYSGYSNTGNYSLTKLDNRMYQLSIPLGLQFDAIQTGKWGVSVGASIQPTFTLNKNVYLISTDYKYYANGESFFRRFNINTAVDLNFSYKTSDKVKFYLGPQIRYQHLPTYNDSYPIKEYRWDYGIRLGIIKSF